MFNDVLLCNLVFSRSIFRNCIIKNTKYYRAVIIELAKYKSLSALNVNLYFNFFMMHLLHDIKTSEKCFLPVVLLIIMALPGRLNAQPGKVQEFDDRVLISLAEHRTPAQSSFLVFMSATNKYVNIGVPAGLLAGGIIGKDKEMRQNALYVASSSAVSYVFHVLIKQLVKRPRPFVSNIKIVPLSHPTSYSFPSGHTSSSFCTAAALSTAYPKWYVIAPSFLWSSSVSYSRMYMGVHYPTDVAGGIILGAGSAVALSGMSR